jgi:hypothetical protein
LPDDEPGFPPPVDEVPFPHEGAGVAATAAVVGVAAGTAAVDAAPEPSHDDGGGVDAGVLEGFTTGTWAARLVAEEPFIPKEGAKVEVRADAWFVVAAEAPDAAEGVGEEEGPAGVARVWTAGAAETELVPVGDGAMSMPTCRRT